LFYSSFVSCNAARNLFGVGRAFAAFAKRLRHKLDVTIGRDNWVEGEFFSAASNFPFCEVASDLDPANGGVTPIPYSSNHSAVRP
jgi:hypothetical protein